MSTDVSLFITKHRVKNGQCITCGNQTHEQSGRGPFRRRLKPLENRYASNGICLICHPEAGGVPSVVARAVDDTPTTCSSGGDHIDPTLSGSRPQEPSLSPSISMPSSTASPVPTHTLPSVPAPDDDESDEQDHKEIKYFSHGRYQGDLDGRDFRHGHGVMRWNNGDVYNGPWRDDKRHGRFGSHKFASGAEYKGQFRNGHFDGHGTLKSNDGGVYVGDFKESKRHGRGTHRYSTNEIYDGEWVDGKKEGLGKQQYSDGSVFEGSFLRHKRHGFGIQTYKNGELYEGEWFGDVKEGSGNFKFADGSSYSGLWVGGLEHGFGEYHFKDGSYYAGDWKEGRREGKGTFWFVNGDKFVGEWKNHKPHGVGTYWANSGEVRVSAYNDGVEVGEGARWTSDRRRAFRLIYGDSADEICLSEAASIAKELSLPVPDK